MVAEGYLGERLGREEADYELWDPGQQLHLARVQQPRPPAPRWVWGHLPMTDVIICIGREGEGQ
jgi:hypothetical protein